MCVCLADGCIRRGVYAGSADVKEPCDVVDIPHRSRKRSAVNGSRLPIVTRIFFKLFRRGVWGAREVE